MRLFILMALFSSLPCSARAASFEFLQNISLSEKNGKQNTAKIFFPSDHSAEEGCFLAIQSTGNFFLAGKYKIHFSHSGKQEEVPAPYWSELSHWSYGQEIQIKCMSKTQQSAAYMVQKTMSRIVRLLP